LEEVSTVRGSGWVADQHATLQLILNAIVTPIRYRRRYWPLPSETSYLRGYG